MVRRGRVRAGRVVLEDGAVAPEGAEVLVEVPPDPTDPTADVFGIWRDRPDVADAREFVRRLRDSAWTR